VKGDYSLNSPHSGAYGTFVRPAIRQGQAPGPRPPAATLGDVQLSQTRTGLSAREREVSPTPFIPTRRVVVRHSPCTPWQPVRLGPKRGLPSLDTPSQGQLAVCPCTLSGVWGGFEMRGVTGQQTAHSGHWPQVRNAAQLPTHSSTKAR